MLPQSYYKTLQVDPSASQEVIEAAYKRLARIYHPDRNQSSDAVQRMQEINEAYGVLRDPTVRREYDRVLARSSRSTVNAASTESSHSSSGYRPNATPRNDYPPQPPACQKCGTIDSSLRVAFFPYVVSIVLLTFRRGWGGIYCLTCRTKEMNTAKMISLFFGWWGIPFGPIYTLGVLFKDSQGELPPEPNAQLLNMLGAYFWGTGQTEEARQALHASYGYVKDPEIRSFYTSNFGSEPSTTPPYRHRRRPQRKSSVPGPIWALLVLASLAIILVALAVIGPGDDRGPNDTETSAVVEAAADPTREGGEVVFGETPTATPVPSATPTSQSTDTPTPADSEESWHTNILGQPTPTPGPLFTARTPPTVHPTTAVVMSNHDLNWVRHLDLDISFLYPNGWWADVHAADDSISISNGDTRLDVYWYEVEDDLTWLFAYNNRNSDVMQEIASDADEDFLASLLGSAPPTKITKYEQAAIGALPTFSGWVHEFMLDGNWTDAEIVAAGGGVVLCGPRRYCEVLYRKVDETFTVEDWAFLETFVENITFIGDEPLPASILTPQPSPTPKPTRTRHKFGSLRKTSTPTRTSIPTSTSTPTSTPVPTATPLPTSTPTLVPTATPTVVSTATSVTNDSRPIDADWILYRSDEAHFEAAIPKEFVSEEYPAEDESPMVGASFAPAWDYTGDDFTVISVMAAPLADIVGNTRYNRLQMSLDLMSWLEEREVDIVSGPEPVDIGSESAVHVVHEKNFDEEGYALRAYSAIARSDDWWYYIEVTGYVEDAQITQSHYEEFVSSFKALE